MVDFSYSVLPCYQSQVAFGLQIVADLQECQADRRNQLSAPKPNAHTCRRDLDGTVLHPVLHVDLYEFSTGDLVTLDCRAELFISFRARNQEHCATPVPRQALLS